MKQLTAQGVVLARTEYGEADRIITFLTAQEGKVRVMAKGVRKPKSKLAGGIELFSISDITFIVGKKDLGTLVSTRLETHFGNIVKDIDRTMFGYDMLKILNKVLEDEGGEEYYDLLVDSLQALNTPGLPRELAEASFLLQLMRLLGHLPNFTNDARGGELHKDGQYQFSFDDMAFFAADNGPFHLNHLKLLRLLAHNPAATLQKVSGLTGYLHELAPLVKQMSKQYVVTF